MKRLLLFLITCLAVSTPSIQTASAYGQWVDCVIVNSAGLNSWGSFGNPSYDVRITSGCSGDVGGVNLEFDPGSFDVYSFDSRQNIFSLSSFSTSKSFSLEGIKPGLYFPSIRITATKDYSSKRVSLPSFTIEAPAQPNLGNNGGTAVLPPSSNKVLVTKQVCVSGANYGPYCTDFPSWTYEICSSNPSGWVQEKVKNTWTKVWEFKGVKSSTSCVKGSIPYLITVNGTTTGTSSMRLSFTKTSSKSGFYSYFNLKVSNK